jgi:transposase
MREKLRFLDMDVHAETIAAAIAEPDGEVRARYLTGWSRYASC